MRSPEGPLDCSGITVNARFLSHRITGVQRYAFEVSSRLAGSNWIAPGEPHDSYPAHAQERARIHSSRILRSHLWEQIALPRQVPRGSLLFSPANSGPLAVANQVLTVHDVSYMEHPEWFSRSFTLWYGTLLPRLVRRVRHVLTDSEFSRSRILEVFQLSEHQVTAIPLGVCPRFHAASAPDVLAMREKYGIRGPYISVVGSLDPRKNLARLFRAWALVQEQMPDLTLAVSGATAQCFPDLGIEQPEGIRMLGYVPDADLPALYTGSEAFVFPSLYEGFGLPPLEAMRCGTPVIVSHAASLPEAVGDAGLYVDPLDVESIAEGILRIIGDRTLQQDLAARGQHRAQQFTWEQTARLTTRVLQSAV